MYYQGAGKRPAAQLKNSDALGPKGREQLNKPADAARFFLFLFLFCFFQRPLYKNVVICKNRDFRVLF